MLVRLLVLTTLPLLLTAPGALAQAGAAAPSSSAVEASRSTPLKERGALELAKSAAGGIEAVFERGLDNLDSILQSSPPKAGTALTMQVLRSAKPLPVRPVFGAGALKLDAPSREALKRANRVVRYVALPQPRFVLAAQAQTPRRRAVGVEIPLRTLAEALDAVKLPAGTRLELLSPQGKPLSHPKQALEPEVVALAATLAGRGSGEQSLGARGVAYAPIGDTGVGVLVLAPAPAPSEPEPAAASASEPVPAVTAPAAKAQSPGLVMPRMVRIDWGRTGLLVGGLAALAGLAVLFAWLRRRWSAQLLASPSAAEGPDLGEVSRLVGGVASGMPALRDTLTTASRTLDRATLAQSPRRLQEARTIAQDLTEQAEGLRERLEQAMQQKPASTSPVWREASGQVTQMALDLALAATQPDRLDAILKVVMQLRELASVLGEQALHAETTDAGGASFQYLTELAVALEGRCHRLEQALEVGEGDDSGALAAARDAVERGMAQASMLSDRVRVLERTLPAASDS